MIDVFRPLVAFLQDRISRVRRYVILYVKDVAASRALYSEAFGLPAGFMRESGDYGELTTGDTTFQNRYEMCPPITSKDSSPGLLNSPPTIRTSSRFSPRMSRWETAKSAPAPSSAPPKTVVSSSPGPIFRSFSWIMTPRRPPHMQHFYVAQRRRMDVLLAADCTAFAMGGFHQKLLKGKTLAIACPKLDQGKEAYIEKLTRMIDDAGINTLTVAMMQVPCCGGLLQIAQAAVAQARRPIPIKQLIVSLEGEIIDEGWVM